VPLLDPLWVRAIGWFTPSDTSTLTVNGWSVVLCWQLSGGVLSWLHVAWGDVTGPLDEGVLRTQS